MIKIKCIEVLPSTLGLSPFRPGLVYQVKINADGSYSLLVGTAEQRISPKVFTQHFIRME